MSNVLVVNASPLIFLSNAGYLDLLLTAFNQKVIVPEAVFREVTESKHMDAAAKLLFEAKWIERASPSTIPEAIIEWDLGSGESAVVALALEIGGARAVIDDLNGRKCALSAGLKVTGTLGVVVSAYRRGIIENPRQVLLELRSAGMWLSDAVIANALRLAGIE